MAYRSKIDQYPPALRINNDIIRTDILMHKIGLMHFHQRKHRLSHNPPADLRRHPAILRHVLLDTVPLNIIHDKICGIILLKKGPRPHNAIHESKLRQHSCLPQEVLFPLVKLLLRLRCKRHNAVRLLLLLTLAPNHSIREILLDRHRDQQILMKTNISNAKAALTKHPADHILAAMQHRPKRQMMRLLLIAVPVKIAGGTFAIPGQRLHTTKTISMFIQNRHSSLKVIVIM